MQPLQNHPTDLVDSNQFDRKTLPAIPMSHRLVVPKDIRSQNPGILLCEPRVFRHFVIQPGNLTAKLLKPVLDRSTYRPNGVEIEGGRHYHHLGSVEILRELHVRPVIPRHELSRSRRFSGLLRRRSIWHAERFLDTPRSSPNIAIHFPSTLFCYVSKFEKTQPTEACLTN